MKQPARFKAIFLSDLHLCTDLPKTTQVFLNFLKKQGQQTEQLYILGDLFQYWIGDEDIKDPYFRTIINAIKALSDDGVRIFWICGNRDFLTGKKFLKATGATALKEPGILQVNHLRIAMVHGDAQCTDDKAYMKFRAKVRNPIWRFFFLLIPLSKRKSIALGARKDSRKNNQEKSAKMMDVNFEAIKMVFEQTQADVLIHGHTHHPANHFITLSNGKKQRMVLSDWNFDDDNPRGDWISVSHDAIIKRHNIQKS